MYLFARRARLAGGRFREAMAWATGIAERVTQISGTQVGVWTQTYSPEVGTVVWGTTFPDLTALEAFSDKVAVDGGYLADLDRGADFVAPGSVDDVLQIVLHGEADPNRRAEYLSVVRTTITAGNIANGTALGVEIAQRATQVTGIPAMFLADATGNYGGVAWISGFTSIGEMERAQTALNTDAGFVELIDSKASRASTTVPGASTQILYRRIAG